MPIEGEIRTREYTPKKSDEAGGATTKSVTEIRVTSVLKLDRIWKIARRVTKKAHVVCHHASAATLSTFADQDRFQGVAFSRANSSGRRR